ncbi:MAG: hypothetical protein KDC85_17175 [Saprospiraceae bacterium]|nr:hypothetical protein [Saprospiraceae bacterium]MCB9327024.1 hypothetical protein [Lewinellaceae bacterium]
MDEKKQNEENKEENTENKSKLEGLELKINALGEITSSLDMDKINKFLDENVEDRKLKEEED